MDEQRRTRKNELPVLDTEALPTGRPLEAWAPGRNAETESSHTVESTSGAESGRGHEADPSIMARRTALKVLAAAAAVPAVGCGPGAGTDGGPDGTDPATGLPAGPATNPHALGTPTDPDLIAPSVPWPMVLDDAEMVTVAALADLIIPADDRSPAASAVGAHEFVNEWVSAPYDGQRRDLVLVRGGMAWLNAESAERFGAPFVDLGVEQQREICDEICHLPDAAPNRRAAARFFDKVRDLVSTGFWTTPEGMADLGYQGNVALASFDGPPPEVLERLGLT